MSNLANQRTAFVIERLEIYTNRHSFGRICYLEFATWSHNRGRRPQVLGSARTHDMGQFFYFYNKLRHPDVIYPRRSTQMSRDKKLRMKFMGNSGRQKFLPIFCCFSSNREVKHRKTANSYSKQLHTKGKRSIFAVCRKGLNGVLNY